jgi:hypothetical protein
VTVDVIQMVIMMMMMAITSVYLLDEKLLHRILSISQSAYDNNDEYTAILIDPHQASSLDSSSTSLPSTSSDV